MRVRQGIGYIMHITYPFLHYTIYVAYLPTRCLRMYVRIHFLGRVYIYMDFTCTWVLWECTWGV
ncbi:hypothetical protein BZA77DRAFT_324977 [Pyronema omphalodes]|nr:hypothetical protein BZA77DRAFT_324977 [Pyronema omphalodes]